MYLWEGRHFKVERNEFLKIVSINFPLDANPYVLDMISDSEGKTVYIDDYSGDEEVIPIAIIAKTEFKYKILACFKIRYIMLTN